MKSNDSLYRLICEKNKSNILEDVIGFFFEKTELRPKKHMGRNSFLRNKKNKA